MNDNNKNDKPLLVHLLDDHADHRHKTAMAILDSGIGNSVCLGGLRVLAYRQCSDADIICANLDRIGEKLNRFKTVSILLDIYANGWDGHMVLTCPLCEQFAIDVAANLVDELADGGYDDACVEIATDTTDIKYWHDLKSCEVQNAVT